MKRPYAIVCEYETGEAHLIGEAQTLDLASAILTHATTPQRRPGVPVGSNPVLACRKRLYHWTGFEWIELAYLNSRGDALPYADTTDALLDDLI